MSATAPSKRIRFRYAKRNRVGRDAVTEATIHAPKAQVIEAQAVGGGVVKILLKKGYSALKSTSIIAEYSLDGTTAWTGTTVTGYTTGDTLITLNAVAVGAKYFRTRGADAFGQSPNSNVVLITVT